MGKFGFGSKKGGDGGDDASRAALFGNKKGGPAPADNPYAQTQPVNDPYMNEANQKFVSPYQQARAGMNQGGPPGAPPGGPQGAPHGKYGEGKYGQASYNSAPQQPAGYGNDKYGASSGYGSNRYGPPGGGAGAGAGAGASRYATARGPGGYGGMGGGSNDDDSTRDALFSGAQERQQKQQQSYGSGAYEDSGAAEESGYGYGQQRELTAEEKEHEEYRDIKKQIHDTTDASLQSTQNSMRYMDQALDTAASTYARLGTQNERLHHTDQLLDSAVQSNLHADTQTKKLKSLNRSMFAVHVNNPFTAKRRTAEQEARVLAQHQEERNIREGTRKDMYSQNARMERKFNDIEQAEAPSSFSRSNRADRSKYTLEDDSDEEGAEALQAKNDQIEDNMDQLAIKARKLHMFAQAQGEEVEAGNKVIDRIGVKSDKVGDGLAVTTARMKRTK